jgi:serine phosphatase RsbU (regulator of sigma subunit)
LELEWAGANHPLWVFKKDKDNSLQFIEIKGDKSPIGYSDNFISFTNHSLQLTKGDQLLLFTDGYADQFGGEKKKKFKRSQLKELMGLIIQQSTVYQKQALEKAFLDWQGEMEQVDDVCVIGVRV